MVRNGGVTVLATVAALVSASSAEGQQMAASYVQASRLYCEAAAKASEPQRSEYVAAANQEAQKARQLGTAAPNCTVGPGVTSGTGANAFASPVAAAALASPDQTAQLVGTAAVGLMQLIDLWATSNAEKEAAERAAEERREEERREEEEREERERLQRAAAEERERVEDPRGWYSKRYATVEEGLTVAREELITAKLLAERGRRTAAHTSFVNAAKILQVMPALYPGNPEVIGTLGVFAQTLASAQESCLTEARVAFRRGEPLPPCGFGDPAAAAPTTILPLDERIVLANEQQILAALAADRGDYHAAAQAFSDAFDMVSELATEFPENSEVRELHASLRERARDAEATCLSERRIRFRRGDTDLPGCSYLPEAKRP